VGTNVERSHVCFGVLFAPLIEDLEAGRRELRTLLLRGLAFDGERVDELERRLEIAHLGALQRERVEQTESLLMERMHELGIVDGTRVRSSALDGTDRFFVLAAFEEQ